MCQTAGCMLACMNSFLHWFLPHTCWSTVLAGTQTVMPPALLHQVPPPISSLHCQQGPAVQHAASAGASSPPRCLPAWEAPACPPRALPNACAPALTLEQAGARQQVEWQRWQWRWGGSQARALATAAPLPPQRLPGRRQAAWPSCWSPRLRQQWRQSSRGGRPAAWSGRAATTKTPWAMSGCGERLMQDPACLPC